VSGRGRAARDPKAPVKVKALVLEEATPVILALDVHARHCVLGAMAEDGRWLGEGSCPTQAEALLQLVRSVRAPQKRLTFEEGSMSLWLCDVLRPVVDELLVCDPRENALIGRSARKRDEWDVRSLCRLYRLGELKAVWHSPEAHRRELQLAAEHYVELRGKVVRCKNTLKAWYRRSGVMVSDTSTVYSQQGRQRWLPQLPEGTRRLSALGHYAVLDSLVAALQQAWQQVKSLGTQCPEIERFTAMPGVGPICAHLFSAFAGCPKRFATKQQLWRYSKLGITDRSSDGKPLGYQRLDRCGNSRLKDLSYQIWKGAITHGDNEIKDFYQQSVERTGDKRHARLNTQRKVLATLWSLWRHEAPYCAGKFAPKSTPPEDSPTPAAGA
jgi:transposase